MGRRHETPEVLKNMAEETKEATNPNYLNGVFYFSNNSKEDFVALWNSIEYTFPAMTCSPMIIPGETPEGIQTIRKRFAYKWAEEQWFKGTEYKKMAKMGNGLPPIRNDKSLEPLIQMCLTPLPIKEATTKASPIEKRVISKSTKIIKEGQDTNSLISEFDKEK